MTASGLPAVWIKWAMSGCCCEGAFVVGLLGAGREDMAEIAVSSEELRAMVLIEPVEAVATGPSMVDLLEPEAGWEAPGGFEVTGSETLRVSFVALEKSKLRCRRGLVYGNRGP